MTAEELAKYCMDYYDKLYSEQSNFRNMWQDIADYEHPRKSNAITGMDSPGRKQTDKLYDSTAIHANELLAASMNGALTSATVKWFALKVRGFEENKEVTDWLEDCSKKIYRALQQSNFNSEIHEVYLDIGAFGTAAIEITENDIERPGFNGLRFTAYSIGEYVVDEDDKGRVNTVIRKFKLSNAAAYGRWGDKVAENIKEKVDKNPTEEIEILHAIMPAKRLGGKGNIHQYTSAYINLSTKKVISTGGFREWPVPVPRWAKSSGEKYGRGPGFTALPDVKTLNKVVELGLKALAKAIDPPLEILDDGVIGSVRLQPSGLNYVRTMGNIKPIEFGAKFDVAKLDEEALRTSIRRIFFSDQLQFQDNPQMTATEVYIRYELMQRLLGPTLGRLESELFNTLIERVFGLMMRAGAFLPVPMSLAQYGEIDIEYEGPMSRAQKSSEIIAIQRTLEIIGPLSNVKPEILDWYDMDKIAKFAPTVTGMPSSLLRNNKEVAQIRKVRQDQQQAAQMKQDMRDMAEGASKLTPLIQMAGETTNKGAKPAGGNV